MKTKNLLKTKVISAIVVLAIVIPLLIVRGIPFAIGVGIISVLALKELIDLKKSHQAIPYPIQFIAVIVLLLFVYMTFDGYSIAFGLSYKAVALAILAFTIPTIFYAKSERYTSKDAFYLIASVFLLGIFFNSLILIVNLNIWLFVYLLLITIMTDTFAMLFGMLIGRHKNVPAVSPNKTWEGSIGGSLLGTFVGTVFYLNMVTPGANVFLVIAVTLGLSIVGQFGDLIFSKIKRENEIKDFSNIMPGHGGILDRLDSLILVTIAYLLLFSII